MADKKQIVKTFSVKKTDNPVIEKFIKKQSNFSESIRYLIIKFCSENGVKDISGRLSEIMYNIDFEQKVDNDLSATDNSNNKSSEIVSDKDEERKNNLNSDLEVKKKEKVIDSSHSKEENYHEDSIEITIDTVSNEDENINQEKASKDISNTNIDDEIPDCYM